LLFIKTTDNHASSFSSCVLHRSATSATFHIQTNTTDNHANTKPNSTSHLVNTKPSNKQQLTSHVRHSYSKPSPLCLPPQIQNPYN
jgi:hypothetical protein